MEKLQITWLQILRCACWAINQPDTAAFCMISNAVVDMRPSAIQDQENVPVGRRNIHSSAKPGEILAHHTIVTPGGTAPQNVDICRRRAYSRC